MVEQPVLQANKWALRRAVTYKVWLDFRNRLKNRIEMLDTAFSLPKKIFWTRVSVPCSDVNRGLLE